MISLVLPDIPAEDRLLARARQGDQEAIMRIYESYFTPIFQYIRLRVEDAHTAEDILATIYHVMGVDPRQEFMDRQGRPIPILSEGAPIKALL